MRKHVRVLLLFALYLAYAIVRHVSYGGVPAEHIPLYVVNKALAWLALTMLSAVLLYGPLVRRHPAEQIRLLRERRWVGNAGLGLGVAHVAITLCILRPEYYHKLFSVKEGSWGLGLQGELTLLMGCLALATLLWLTRLVGEPLERSARAVRFATGLVVALGCLHVTVLGIDSWFAPQHWPGGLPPITLIAFGMALACLVLRALGVRMFGEMTPELSRITSTGEVPTAPKQLAPPQQRQQEG